MTAALPVRSWYARGGKRVFDFIAGGFLLALVLPLLLLLGLAILLCDGWPVLFRQQRPGLRGRPFVLVKFRTMRARKAATPEDADRLTRLGSFLRRYSLDELPELWCVLRGDMSLVGPRPLLMEYMPLYSREQSRRHEVRPGLTGWAQIHGRNALSWEERFEHDVWYVDHCSLGLDLAILLGTISKVVRGTGISAPGHQTMPRFRGSRSQK